jgi:hypothetical protein
MDDLSSFGDPAGMRRLAAEFSTRAEAVAATIKSLSVSVAATTFEGPAATQLSAAMRAREERGRQTVLRLEAAAATLRRAAGRVEDEIDEERAALRRAVERDPER